VGVHHVLEEPSQGDHPKPARNQYNIVPCHFIDWKAIAEGTADTDSFALADAVEEKIGQDAGPSNNEIKGPPPSWRGWKRERGLSHAEDRELYELTRPKSKVGREGGIFEAQLEEPCIGYQLGDPKDARRGGKIGI
jgi:hypothetical protein